MSDAYRSRQTTIQIVFVGAAILLLGRALFLQVISNEYASRAEATAISENVLYPARGLMYDRNDKLLVYNNPLYDLMVVYNQISHEMDTLHFCSLLGISITEFEERLNKDFRSSQYSRSIPFVFMDKLSVKTYATFQESLYGFPGFFVKQRTTRGYPHQHAANLLGYTREVNADEVKKSREKAKKDENAYLYAPGDYVGDSGLEKWYEPEIRGKKGKELVLKDNLGREVDAFNAGKSNEIPTSGEDLVISIDLELQAYAESLMQNKRGAIVAIKPDKGEILTMVSAPTYDPNRLVISEERGKEYSKLSQDPNLPFYDRAIMAQYPPGSLFKPLVALIALNEGIINPNRTIRCSGAYYLGGKRLTGCHGHATCTGVDKAIQHSCNTYFVTVFKEFLDNVGGSQNPGKGLDAFNEYLAKFGMGDRLGIDLPRENKGNIPGSEYYDEVYKEEVNGWKSIWVRSLGIGQGELEMTNLQLANAAAAIANRGWYITPHLVIGTRKPGSKVMDPLDWSEKRKTLDINPIHFEPVVDGMEAVVLAGTARIAQIPGVSFCGKTGTAENNQRNKKDHSIFFGFAPKENPQIAICAYVENAGFGATYAAPIASLVAERYINSLKVETKNKGLSPNRQYLENRVKNAVLIDKTLAASN